MQCEGCDATAMFRVVLDGTERPVCGDHARYYADRGAEVVSLAE